MGSDTSPPAYIPDESDPAHIIVELCKQFYAQGGMPATAGGMSILDGDILYITPSGVQKERIRPHEVIVMDLNAPHAVHSQNNFKPSACLPLFRAIHELTPAKACIHTHGVNSVLAASYSMRKYFEIKDVENIKAIPRSFTERKNYNNYDTLRIPIIDNRPHEEDLEEMLRAEIAKNPNNMALLVRGHGLFVWGETVWKAKIVHEAVEYLCEVRHRQQEKRFMICSLILLIAIAVVVVIASNR